jgi:hypothetical protein
MKGSGAEQRFTSPPPLGRPAHPVSGRRTRRSIALNSQLAHPQRDAPEPPADEYAAYIGGKAFLSIDGATQVRAEALQLKTKHSLF